MPISEQKLAALKALEEQLGVSAKDFEEKFVKGSGKGGQKQNKTSNCVLLTHLPSGKKVKCQKDRSREINRFLAKRQIVEELAEEAGLIVSKRTREIEKIRRRKGKKVPGSRTQ